MKKCAYCGAEYADDVTVCAIDQQPLCAEATPEAVSESINKSSILPEIIAPSILWLLGVIVLSAFLGPFGWYVLNLSCAFWVAIDCSKIQEKGSRVLGLAFKPVVMFAACAFFCFGLGFLWYLILRHWVNNSPEPLDGAVAMNKL